MGEEITAVEFEADGFARFVRGLADNLKNPMTASMETTARISVAPRESGFCRVTAGGNPVLGLAVESHRVMPQHFFPQFLIQGPIQELIG